MNVQRQKEMTSDTAKLVELAHQLKIQMRTRARTGCAFDP
jgi:hypothetical protein